jgi:hypothetical protein
MSDVIEAVTDPESAAGKAVPETPPVSERDRLIEAMTKGTLDKLPEQPVFEEKPVEDKPSEETPSQLEEVLKDPVTPATELATETEKPAAAEKAAPVIEDDEAAYSQRTRDRITKLSKEASYGNLINTMASRSGVKADEMTAWASLRAGLQLNDPAAKAELIRLAKVLDPTLGQPVAAVMPTEADIATAADTIYKDTFKSGVDAQHVEEPYAREQARKLATRQVLDAASRSRPAPAPVVQQPAQAAPAPQFNPLVDAASQEVERLRQEYAAKMPGWDKLDAEVGAEIRAKHAGANPIQWPQLYMETVKAVQARHAPVIDKRAAVKNLGLRSSSTAGAQGTGKGVTGREEALGILTGRIKL